MQLVWFGLAAFVLMILLAILFRLFEPNGLKATVHDPLNTKLKKLSSKALATMEKIRSVSYGTCTTTKQVVWQHPVVQHMNTIFVGPNGVGKTAHIVSTAIKQFIGFKENAIVIFEGKNDKKLIGLIQVLCKLANRELVVLPYDGGYNPLGVGNSAEERASIFCSMIQLAREGMKGDAKFYTDEMVKFISLIIPIFERVYHVPCTINELRLLATSQEVRNNLLDQAKGTEDYIQFTEAYSAYSPKDISDKLASLVSMITEMYTVKGGITNRSTLYNQRMAKGLGAAIDRKAVIVVAEGGNQGTSEHHLGMLYLAELMNYVRVRTTKHDLVVFIDELHYYLSDSFVEFQATSRAANVTQILGVQTFAMLEALSEEAAESIKTNCRTWIVHTDLNYADAVTVSEKVGKRPHVAYSRSKSPNMLPGEAGRGEHLEDKFLIDPYKIQNMNPAHVLYLSINEDRGREPARYLMKPPILNDGGCLYTPLIPAITMPVAMWNLQAQQQAQGLSPQINQALNNIAKKRRKRII